MAWVGPKGSGVEVLMMIEVLLARPFSIASIEQIGNYDGLGVGITSDGAIGVVGMELWLSKR